LILTDQYMCPRHWRGLPAPVKREINLAWDKRKEAVAALLRAIKGDVPDEQLRRMRDYYRKASDGHERIKADVVAMLIEAERVEDNADHERDQAGEADQDAADSGGHQPEGSPGN
jgi:hypothetical protein